MKRLWTWFVQGNCGVAAGMMLDAPAGGGGEGGGGIGCLERIEPSTFSSLRPALAAAGEDANVRIVRQIAEWISEPNS